jgi:hypothetical protein
MGAGGSAGTADGGFGEGRFGLRSEEEMVVSGGLRVFGCTLYEGWLPCYAKHCPTRFPALSTLIFDHIRTSMIARCLISTSQSFRRTSYFWR